MKKLIIIDISNFIFRAFFAIRPLHAPDGTPVNAVYGVLSMLHNMLLAHKPTHVLIARDTKDGSFRKEMYPEYKAHRTEPPDELIPQFPIVEELLKELQLPQVMVPRFEADDIIGSVATQWKESFDEILIASGDKDLMQFVAGPVKMLDTMKEKIYQREDVKDKMGVYPEQIVDFLALIGDSSDNIPGVPGIGPKGAQKLLEDYGTLEKILQHVDEISNKRSQTALKENTELAKISKSLAKIVTDMKLELAPSDVSYQLKLTPELEAFLERLGFRTWLSKLAPFKVKSNNTSPDIKPPKLKSSIKNWSISEFQDALKLPGPLAVARFQDHELDQLKSWDSLAVAIADRVGFLSLNQSDGKDFFQLLSTSDKMVICYQSKPLIQQSLIHGIEPEFNFFDLAQAHFLINPEYRHDFETLMEEFLGEKIEMTKTGQTDLFGNESDDSKQSIGEKAQAILKLQPILRQKMEELKVASPYDDLDIPLIRVLAKMELEGVHLNVAFYKELEHDFTQQIDLIENDIIHLAGGKVNLRSPKQVGELLFEKLQLPVIRKTKTGYSTDADVLNELAALQISPIPEQLLKYREIEKLLSTYVKALPLMVHPQTGKIHTHFQPSNAATGRLSSDHPNLQNIPVRSENGRKLRKGFVPSQGRVLLSADYSQVELRLLAHFSQDQYMLDAFTHDVDIHVQTAAEIFEVPVNQVTKEMRGSAKAINFGLMYGQTSFGLSQALKISQGEAKKYITAYFKKFSSVKSYLDSLKEKAEATGYAETLFGRKRILPDIKSTNRQVKAMAERVAINSPIQGTAADIIKLAMINIQKLLENRKLQSRMILQVHDELIFDVPPSELDLMLKLVAQEMEGAVKLTVPLKVNLGYGDNWYDLK